MDDGQSDFNNGDYDTQGILNTCTDWTGKDI